MFDWLVDLFTHSPYLGVAAVFALCSIGLPLPEELVLISAGYVCFKGWAHLLPMMGTAAGAILAGDLLPFFLGHTFGSRLLRIRPLRVLVNKRRLAKFDQWFRRRGDLVIFFARFVTGLRVVAYFTAGAMKTSYPRFIALDLMGIALVVPLLVWIGCHFGGIIDDAIAKVQTVERGILIAVAGGAALIALLYWLRKRRLHQASAGPSETFVEPSRPPTDGAEPPAKPPGS